MHNTPKPRKRKKIGRLANPFEILEENDEASLEALSLDDISDVIGRDPEGRPVVEIEDL